MLDFLLGPVARRLLEIGIVGEDIAQINRVIATIVLDHARGFDNGENLKIDFRRLERWPGDVFERPVLHRLSCGVRVSYWLGRSRPRISNYMTLPATFNGGTSENRPFATC